MPPMLKDFIAFELSKRLYQRCKTVRRPHYVKDQLLRASLSISLNLAESSGRRTEKERLRYFTMALGSLRECEALVELEEIRDTETQDLLRQLGAILFKLCRLSQPATTPAPIQVLDP
jgi:four helix bundle protein